MEWTVHGERSIYRSPWVELALVDVEIPDGPRFDHHVIRTPNDAAGAVVFDPDRGVLLLWRHRFITDTWGWEIPAGGLDSGEEAEAAAVRETIEETGWMPRELSPLVRYHPTNGLSDQRFHIFVARGATHVGEPTDPGEAERIEWVPLSDVRAAIATGTVTDGLSLTGLLAALALGAIA